MPKVRTTIDRFDGGMVSDIRDPRENICRLVMNFDLTNPRKMTPWRSSVSGDSSASTSQKRNFCTALRTGTTYSLYGLGEVSGSSDKAEILYKKLTTGAADDLDDATWAATTNNASTTKEGTAFNLFVYYRKTGRIYGAHAGTHIWAYDPAGTVAFNETERAITYTDIAQGLVHSLDDILYIAYDNKIATNDNGAWVDEALVVPANYKITSISEYGLYLAIAVVDRGNIGNSRVLLWSRQPGTSFLVDSIDFGEGKLHIIEQVEGILIGISVKESLTGNVSVFLEKFIFRYYTPGTGVVKFEELPGAVDFQVINLRQKLNDRVYFLSTLTINGTVRSGLWSIGKVKSGGFSIIHERSHDNNTSGSGVLGYAFIVVGDYVFISYNTGSAFALSKTNSSATYAHNSIYESKRLDGGDASLKKDLKGISIKTEYLPSSSSVKVAYKRDNETQYTTIMNHNTTGAISKSAICLQNLTSTGDVVTITAANPAEIALTAHGLVSGQRIMFSTSGALPAAVVAGKTYYVLSSGLGADTFNMSATDGGTAVDTTGNTQSGTHKIDRTFPLPKGYKELELRVISTGGAEVTALELTEEVISGRNY